MVHLEHSEREFTAAAVATALPLVEKDPLVLAIRQRCLGVSAGRSQPVWDETVILRTPYAESNDGRVQDKVCHCLIIASMVSRLEVDKYERWCRKNCS